MSDTEIHKLIYRFGSYELCVDNGDLRKNGVKLKLQEQPRRILLLLLEHPGDVLTREQIQKSLWPDDTFVDFDNAINSAVRKLRDVLSDNAENPRFVATVARRGYRFLPPVSVTEPNAPQREPEPPPLDAFSGHGAVAGKRSRLFFALATIAALLIAVIALKPTRGGHEQALTNTRIVPLTSNAGLELQPSFSPDGTRIAYVWDGKDKKNFAVYVKLIGAGDPARVTWDLARDFSPAWSPDGRWIAALRDAGQMSAVILIPASGGRHRELTRVTKAAATSNPCVSTDWPHVCGLSYWGPLLQWSRDGKYLFTSASEKHDSALSIVRISVETGERRVITSPPSGIEGDFGPAVSPDGSQLAFVRMISAKVADLYVQPLSVSTPAKFEPKRITLDGTDLASPAWTTGGRQLVFSSDRSGQHQLWRVEASGSGKPVLTGMGENASDVAISPVGQRLAYSRGATFASLWKMPLDQGKGGLPVRITETTARDKFSHLSPDGKRIAFQSGRTGVDEIWVCDTDGTNAVQSTRFGKGMSGSPRWSPDGQSIAFDSNATGEWRVHLIRSDGGNPIQVTAARGNAFMPSWSRDGRWIYFSSTRSGTMEIWKTRVDGSSETQVTSGGALTANESADRKWLYFKRGSDIDGDLWKMLLGGGTATKVLDSVMGRAFTVTKKGIYFAAGSPALELRYLNFKNGSIRTVAPLASLFAYADVSADERWVVYPRFGSTGANLMLAENFR